MKILITGAQGMLGRTLMQALADHTCLGVDLETCDITKPEEVVRAVATARPEVILHTAAMTAVDDCESERDLAWQVNAEGSRHVAQAGARYGARVIAFSTDYVFAGDLDRPYRESDTPNPQTVYGQSKLAGERAVCEACPDHLIARIAWLYGAGGPSFLHTMMRLGQDDGPPLQVVDDQIGNPTSCHAVARMIERILSTPLTGVVHMTCEGEATWCDFAQAIFAALGLPRRITPCASAAFPRPAPRPANSRLEATRLAKAGLDPMPTWQNALDTFLQAHPTG